MISCCTTRFLGKGIQKWGVGNQEEGEGGRGMSVNRGGSGVRLSAWGLWPKGKRDANLGRGRVWCSLCSSVIPQMVTATLASQGTGLGWVGESGRVHADPGCPRSTGMEGMALMADVFLVIAKSPSNSNSILEQWFLSHVPKGPGHSLAKTRCLLTAQSKSWLPCPNLQEISKLTV